jgi:ubiquinone/menaquinone biosynthesis C-methylase UbiE
MINKPKDEIWLNIGCGISFYKDFINVDKYVDMEDIRKRLKAKDPILKNAFIEKGAKYVKGDITELPFPDNYADYIETVDVIEHVSHWDVQKAFNELYRVSKKGGTLKMLTVSFDSIAQMWIEAVVGKNYTECHEWYHNISEIIFGNQMHEGEFHKVPLNPSYISYLMKQAGWYDFKIEIYPRGNSSFPDLETNASPHRYINEPFYHRQDSIYVEAVK